MKTSFYFVAWLCAYVIIGFSGVSFLQNNSIFVALILVYVIAGFMNKRFAKEIWHIRSKQDIALLETIYSDNIKKYKQDCRTRLIIDGACFTYFLLAIVGLLMLRIGSFLEFVIFVLIFLMITHSTYKQLKQYMIVRDATSFTPDIINKILTPQGVNQYESYRSQRPYRSPEDFVLNKDTSLGTYKVATMIGAIGCLLIGLWYIWQAVAYLITSPGIDFLTISLAMYASIAMYFGIRDLIDCVRNT